MSYVAAIFRKLCSYLYLLIGNNYADRLFWRGIRSGFEGIQTLSCILRYQQLRILNYVERGVDREVLDFVVTKDKVRNCNYVENDLSKAISDFGISVESPIFRLTPAGLRHSCLTSRDTREESQKYPTISIVTPSLNQGRFLEKTVHSVLSQNYPHLEYIIIDGGSTDGSVEIIKKYEKVLKYWTSEKDNGQADAINKGLKYVTGAVFSWLNSDDYLEPGALFKCAEAYNKNPTAAAWIGACRKVDINDNILETIFPNNLDIHNIGQNWNGRQFMQPSCFLSVSRLKEVGGLNTNLYFSFDLDLWIRLLKKGKLVQGDGIWSNALVHSDAKTQKLRPKMHLETINLLKEHGFNDGANIREKNIFKKRKLQYVISKSSNDKLKKIKLAYRINKDLFKKKAVITLIGDDIPIYDNTPGESRLLTILQVFITNGFTINYLCTSSYNESTQKYICSLYKNIKVYNVWPYNENVKTILNKVYTDYVLLIPANKLRKMKTQMNIVEILKQKNTKAKIIVDASELANGDLRSDEKLPLRHKQDRKLRVESDYKMMFDTLADRIIVSALNQSKIIEQKLSINTPIDIIPYIYRVCNVTAPFRKRKNICFLANSDQTQSVHDLNNFIEGILPYIRTKRPRLQLFILVENLKIGQNKHKSDAVKFIDKKSKLPVLLANCRIAVFPLSKETNGNHNLGLVAGAGLPFVSSSVAAQDYPFTNGVDCFIEDSASEFAQKCNQCIDDPITWYNFRVKLQLLVAERYSPVVITKNLIQLLNSLE